MQRREACIDCVVGDNLTPHRILLSGYDAVSPMHLPLERGCRHTATATTPNTATAPNITCTASAVSSCRPPAVGAPKLQKAAAARRAAQRCLPHAAA